MNIDLEHLHYWMCAIRESRDPLRTLDAFWKGQINSKLWLIEKLKPFVNKPVTIDIHGGWVGVLSSMLFQSGIPIKHIRSIDIDASCESIASMMNKGEEIQGKFIAITSNMCDIESSANVVINTSCEHITQQKYEQWLDRVSADSLLVLQSNNYHIDEHVRTAESLEEFIQQSAIRVLWSGELKLLQYTRWMMIGKKCID